MLVGGVGWEVWGEGGGFEGGGTEGGQIKRIVVCSFFKIFLPHSRFFLFESKANRRRRLPFGGYAH